MKQALVVPYIKVILTSFLALWILPAQGLLHVAGTYDLNNNGRSEILIIDALDAPLKYVELDAEGNHKILWQYSLPSSQRVTDAKLVDLGKKGSLELVVSITTVADNGKEAQPWLLVFPWEGNSFAEKPLTLNHPAGDTDRYRPLNLTVEETSGRMAVALASPSRAGLLMRLDLSPDSLLILSQDTVQPDIIRNGYGRIFTGLFRQGENSFLAVVSPEGNVLKTSVFSLSNPPKEIVTDILVANGARNLIGQAIMAFDENMDGVEELLLPFKTGEVLKLSLVENSLTLSKSRFSGKGLFIIPRSANALEINDLLLARVEEGLYKSSPPKERMEESFAYTIEDTLLLGDSLDYFVLPDSAAEFYSFRWTRPPPSGMIFNPSTYSLKWMPTRENLGPVQVSYKVEIRTEEKLLSTRDRIGDRHQITSILSMKSDSLVILVADTLFIQKQLNPMVLVLPRNYYLSLYSPKISQSDRYVFEGEPPYGVHSIILPDSLSGGVSTIISANLNSITRDKTAIFSFKSTGIDPDSIVTLSLIHDLGKNLLYTNIYPPLDTVIQSFHPQDWNSDLYAYPDYLFEGFPAQMNMDSSKGGIIFSLPKVRAHEEGVIGLVSPLTQDHSLHIYYTGGLPHAVRGEVRVKDDGSHKIITEIDFSGFFRPIRITVGFKPSQRDTLVFYPDTSLLETSRFYAPAKKLKPISVEVPQEEKMGEADGEAATVPSPIKIEPIMEELIDDTSVVEEIIKIKNELPETEELLPIQEVGDTTLVSPEEMIPELEATTLDTIISPDTLTTIPTPAELPPLLIPDTLNSVLPGDTLFPADSL